MGGGHEGAKGMREIKDSVRLGAQIRMSDQLSLFIVQASVFCTHGAAICGQ